MKQVLNQSYWRVTSDVGEAGASATRAILPPRPTPLDRAQLLGAQLTSPKLDRTEKALPEAV
jgi:hypothetical protein